MAWYLVRYNAPCPCGTEAEWVTWLEPTYSPWERVVQVQYEIEHDGPCNERTAA